MTRSSWKGKFINIMLLRQLYFLSKSKLKKNMIYSVWSRDSIILPDFVGLNVQIHNGHKFMKLIINERMVNHKFGEFSFTKKMGKNIHPVQIKIPSKKKKKK